MRKLVSVYQAKTELSKLLDEALEGNQIVITRHGIPIAEIKGLEKPRLELGAMATEAKNWPELTPEFFDMGDEFDAWQQNMDQIEL
jgi:prevent-host-death family protein